MEREAYIERLVRLFRLKYHPSDLEVEEFRLALEAIPDRNGIITPQVVPSFPVREFDPQPVAYGPIYPTPVAYGPIYPQRDSAWPADGHVSTTLTNLINSDNDGKEEKKT